MEIHKRLKDFLRWELERYLFQVMKWDTKWRIDVLSVENKIEEIKKKYEWFLLLLKNTFSSGLNTLTHSANF